MSQHRTTGGAGESRLTARANASRGSHRLPAPPSALRGRVMVAAVAVGAFAAAGAAGQALPAHAENDAPATNDRIMPVTDVANGAAAFGVGGDTVPVALQVLPDAKVVNASTEAAKLTKSVQIAEHKAAEEAEARRPKFSVPARGDFTSGFGARWGTTHYGIDIAGPIGTPILAAADGVVIEAGPASGFGLWVRLQHADGTITVYGHMDTYSVQAGQRVKAGEQIARMGSRGYSTGSHLHFEVWDAGNQKINPLTWLNARGISV